MAETKEKSRVVAVGGLTERCSYCQIIVNHFNQTDRGLRELRACGVEVTISVGPIPLATHFHYPHSGAMSVNAMPICEGHALMIRGVEEFGSLDAYVASLNQ